ncbi:MAG: Asp-tRNA(Asn)/Glu-tRNA(Gln) amidotransferase subunit GatB [Chloroflexi bacterium]|nr:Asp-tRNA(Asn)/Glu-tRNA(Gln) amidotransferase subunit GatB [Chloroflexota bacterium]
MTEYETVIGLEVHAQLRTSSKMYCACPADYQDSEPNTRVCPVCLGLPGSLPVINREAIRSIIMIGLALHCSIPSHSKFDRKNYPYPDLMKGYQISQYDLPLCVDGYMDVNVEGERRRVGIERVHMEEDVAKLSHLTDPATGEGYSLVDVNRSGVPLVEMVSRPDIRSAEEARQYLMAYQSILRYLGVSTANMDEGSFRCDANVSIRPKGSETFGTKVEVKNMNSFRSVFRAIEHEVERQAKVLGSGGRVVQETRGWLEDKGVTTSLRSKEEANDYRYFPEPDLPPLNVDPAWVAEISELLPELPEERRLRFTTEHGLPAYDASLLTATPGLADYYEATLRHAREGGSADGVAKAAANWTLTELGRLANETHTEIHESPVTPERLAELLVILENGTLGTPQGKRAIEEMFHTGKSAQAVVADLGLVQISDTDELAGTVAQAIDSNPQAVADYLAGKETAAKFLVGQVMKATRGNANPSVVADIIVEQLDAMKG